MARADEPTFPAQSATEVPAQARQMYTAGVVARRAREWERAHQLFLEAWRIHRHWQIAANLANVELALGKYRDAAEHADFFLRETRGIQEVELDQRASVARDFASARIKVGEIMITAPPGAEVLVDQASVGKAPLEAPIYVEPGQRVIAARLEGRSTNTEVRVLEPGGAAHVELRFVAREDVWSPVAVKPVSPEPPQQKAAVGIASKGRSRSVVPTVLFGVGAAAFLGGGIAFTIVSNDKATEANGAAEALQKKYKTDDACELPRPPRRSCDALHAKNSSSDTYHNLAMAGFLAAGVAGAAALTSALWPTKRPAARTGLQIVPLVGASTGGFAASGSF